MDGSKLRWPRHWTPDEVHAAHLARAGRAALLAAWDLDGPPTLTGGGGGGGGGKTHADRLARLAFDARPPSSAPSAGQRTGYRCLLPEMIIMSF